MKLLLLPLTVAMFLTVGGATIELNPHLAYAADTKKQRPPAPKNDENPEVGKDGASDKDDYRVQKGNAVSDPFNKKGPKIDASLVELYWEYKDRSEDDFNRAKKTIHGEERPAEETDAYRSLRDRRKRVDAKLKSLEENYSNRKKIALQDNDALKKALEDIKGTPDNPKGKQEQKIIEKALNGKLGKLSKQNKNRLNNLRTLVDWINRLRDARATLDDMQKLLEDTGSIYPVSERRKLGGETQKFARRVDRISGASKSEWKHYAVDDELNRTKIIKKGERKRNEDETKSDPGTEETETTREKMARREADKSANQPSPKLACDVLGGEWRSGTLAKIGQITTNWKKGVSSCSGASDDCRMRRGSLSFQAYMQSLMIWQCHASFIKRSQKASKDDRKRAREEACAIEKTLEKMANQIKATGYMKAGANWKPLHLDTREKWGLKDPCETVQVEEASSAPEKQPKPAVKPATQAKPKQKCEGGGLLGAMNCVTKRIEQAGTGSERKPRKSPASATSTDRRTGETTTSVKNPDGSHTVTKTDKDGKVLSKKIVRKSPASASSTDRNTGVTTTSVRNPDGTRTVTKTDKDGNILSRERVGKSPDSANSTEMNTGETTTSVANPDGSRTVTKTDKEGNILSREKVR